MLYMGNEHADAECYGCVREMMSLFAELAALQQKGFAQEADVAAIDAAGEAYQRRAESFVLKLAEHYGVTVSNEDVVVAVDETGEFIAPGEVSANQDKR